MNNLTHRDDGTASAITSSYLRLPDGRVHYPQWGWTFGGDVTADDADQAMDPLRRWNEQQLGNPARGIAIGLCLSLAIWTVLISGLYWAVRLGAFK